jgi:hypothetical protein
MKQKAQRHWLRFSLRTVLVIVTICCVWLAWQVSVVRERKAMLKLVIERGGSYSFLADYSPFAAADRTPKELSYLRRALLRDELVGSIALPPVISADEIAKVRRTFPEAAVMTTNQ